MSATFRIDAAKFIGRTLGNVTLLSVLGEGSMATVFLGFQRSLSRQVAVKVLLKTGFASPAASKLFRAEARLVASLSHPNIVPIHEMGEEADCFFQVMQVVKGESLGSIMQRHLLNPLPSRRALPLDRTIDILIAVLDGLSYAHEEGVVHRDIKPANILIENRSGRPVIADFGIARTIGVAKPTDSDTIEGSPVYMAPEYVAGAAPDCRVDLYAAGIVLYQMTAGDLPLAEREPMALLSRKLNDPESVFTMRPSQASSLIDPALERIILMAIAPSPGRRYQSGRHFIDDLRSYRTHHLPAAVGGQRTAP